MMNKKPLKIALASILAGAAMTLFSGCGGDKFEGTWIQDTAASKNGNSVVEYVIKKNGDNQYLVDINLYEYKKVKDDFTDEKTDKTVEIVNFSTLVNHEHIEKPVYKKNVTYQWTKDPAHQGIPAAAKDNRMSIQGIFGSQYHIDYLKEDGSLLSDHLAGMSSGRMRLKKESKDLVTKAKETAQKAVKEKIAEYDKEVGGRSSRGYDYDMKKYYITDQINFQDEEVKK